MQNRLGTRPHAVRDPRELRELFAAANMTTILLAYQKSYQAEVEQLDFDPELVVVADCSDPVGRQFAIEHEREAGFAALKAEVMGGGSTDDRTFCYCRPVSIAVAREHFGAQFPDMGPVEPQSGRIPVVVLALGGASFFNMRVDDTIVELPE